MTPSAFLHDTTDDIEAAIPGETDAEAAPDAREDVIQ